MQGFYDNQTLNLDLLQTAIRLGKTKGYQIIIAGLPRNPIADRSVLSSYIPDYLEKLQRLADDEDVPFVDFHSRLALPQGAFYDHVHILDESRSTFERALFEVIVDHLEDS